MGRQLPTYCKHTLATYGGTDIKSVCPHCISEAHERERKLAAYDEQIKLIKVLLNVTDTLVGYAEDSLHHEQQAMKGYERISNINEIKSDIDRAYSALDNARAHLNNQEG